MNWKRAGLLGIGLWIIIFFEVCILMFGFGLNDNNVNYYLIHYILLSLFVILSSLSYFNGKKIKKGIAEGIVLGCIFVAVGMILDSVLTIPLFILKQGGSYFGFLFSSQMLISYAIVIFLSGIIGLIKKIKK